MFRVEFEWDRDSFVDASMAVYRYELSKSPKRFLGFIFIALSQFGVVILLKRGQIGLLLLSSLLLIYWYFLREKIRRKIYEKSFREGKFILEIENNQLKINKIGIDWQDISKVLVFDKGFVIFYKNQSLFIPKSPFSPSQLREFVEILKKNIENFEEID